MIDDEEKEFDKKEAQILSFQLIAFIKALKKYCCYYYDNENMDNVILVLKHINMLADKLYCTLDSWEVYEEGLLKNKRVI